MHDVIRRLVDAEQAARQQLDEADRDSAAVLADARRAAAALLEAARQEGNRRARDWIEAALAEAGAAKAEALDAARQEPTAQPGWNEELRQQLVAAVAARIGGSA